MTAEYRYYRGRCPKKSMDEEYQNTTDITFACCHIDLLGRTRNTIRTLSQEDLVGRKYLCYWDLSRKIGLLWLDKIELAHRDPRLAEQPFRKSGTLYTASTSILTFTEYDTFTSRLHMRKISTNDLWAPPVHVGE